eukprot:78117_1
MIRTPRLLRRTSTFITSSSPSSSLVVPALPIHHSHKSAILSGGQQALLIQVRQFTLSSSKSKNHTTMVRSRSSRSRVIASGILLLQHPCTRTYTSTVSVSALSTSINLHNPSLLRAPAVTFHRESLEVYDPSASQ